MAIAPYQLGFSTTYEGELHALPVQGHIPDWLNGSLIRTGPGTLQVGEQYSPDCYAGEPVFVAAPHTQLNGQPQPNTQPEDAGVVLSVVLNTQTQTSFLLVLDGQSWQELARVQLPYHLPFDFHGQYFDSTDATQRTQLHR